MAIARKPYTTSCTSEVVVRSVVFGVQLEEMRKNEDPRLSFSTPEFKEAQRIFTDGFKVDFCHLCVSSSRPYFQLGNQLST